MMVAGRAFTLKKKKAIAAAYDEGLEVAEISREFKVAKGSIFVIAGEHAKTWGTRKRGGRPTALARREISEDKKREMADAYDSGMTLQLVACSFGVTWRKAREIIKKYAKPRSRQLLRAHKNQKRVADPEAEAAKTALQRAGYVPVYCRGKVLIAGGEHRQGFRPRLRRLGKDDEYQVGTRVLSRAAMIALARRVERRRAA